MWDLRKENKYMDAKLVNPFVDAFTAVMPQIGFAEPKRTKMGVKAQNAVSLGVSVIVGFTKQIRGNIVYNMSEDTANGFISSLLLLFVIVYVNLSMIEVSEIKIIAKDNDKEKEKDKITPRYFIKKDSYMCPCCGCVVERRDLPNFPELDIAEDVRDELLCPYCGNLGLNYMISDDKMIGYTIYGRKEK